MGVATLCSPTHHVLYHLHIVMVQDFQMAHPLRGILAHAGSIPWGHCVSSTTALILFYTKGASILTTLIYDLAIENSIQQSSMIVTITQ